MTEMNVSGEKRKRNSHEEEWFDWVNEWDGREDDLLEGVPLFSGAEIRSKEEEQETDHGYNITKSDMSPIPSIFKGKGEESGGDPPNETPTQMTRLFPPRELNDFKHILYNLLSESYSNPGGDNFVCHVTVTYKGEQRQGFRFNPNHNPERKLAELYAQHLRKEELPARIQSEVFREDLYKFYHRACNELMLKYFWKVDNWTWVYDGEPLFQPTDTLEIAEKRLQNLHTKSRKRAQKRSAEAKK